MSVVVHPGRLREELARRALSASGLAHAAGLSPATISAALAGRAISAKSLELIAHVLMRTPVIEVVDALLLREADDHALS